MGKVLVDARKKNVSRLVFFLVSCRPFELDWRLPLFEALHEQADYYHIRLGRISILTNGQSKEVRNYRLSEFSVLVREIRYITGPSKIPVYFVSMAAALPSLTVALRLLLRRGIWLFDVYDDFSLYWGSQLYRLKGYIVNLVFHRLMTATIIAPPNLRKKFPNAYWLEMASDIKPAEHDWLDCKRLLITSNLDGRLDYAFVRGVAQGLPDCEIHIYGRINNPSRDLWQVRKLLSSSDNIKYCGEFAEAEFQQMLANYCVALAPFRVNVPFTKSTDPVRFYDYLNAGLEVISTDIPRARDRRDFLHIAHSPAEAAEICKRLWSRPQLRKTFCWNWTKHSWRYRSKQLLQIIEKIVAETT